MGCTKCNIVLVLPLELILSRNCQHKCFRFSLEKQYKNAFWKLLVKIDVVVDWCKIRKAQNEHLNIVCQNFNSRHSYNLITIVKSSFHRKGENISWRIWYGRIGEVGYFFDRNSDQNSRNYFKAFYFLHAVILEEFW